jgi:Cdc48 subfamily AAA family protein
MSPQLTTESQTAPFSSRWVANFNKQLQHRKHIVLYGNIHDLFLFRGEHLTVNDFLIATFQDMGYQIVVRYDQIDGFAFFRPGDAPPTPAQEPLPADMGEKFEELVRRGIAARNPSLVTAAAPPATAPVDDPMQPPPRSVPGRVPGQTPDQNRVIPGIAFGHLRHVLRQDSTSCAAVVDLGDMITSDPSRYSESERDALMLLKKATLEAAIIPNGNLAGRRNTLIILAGELKRVPEWFYHDNPYVSLVRASRPDKEERKQFALYHVRPEGSFRGFLGGDSISAEQPASGQASPLESLAEEFADLTEGMQTIDLDALRAASHTAGIRIRPKQVRQLVDYFKFGVKDDPWEKLDPTKVRSASQVLSRRVIGQPNAVEAVVDMLTSAMVGLRSNAGGAKPKGIFFFVGPTGVGKTELAKALSELVFSDERAFARFDMSEYKEEHAAEKLAGAPPGFVGYEEGGQLTNRVLEQPHSILLFDEIEKAHPRVLDKFLQVLEDGRLTDGKGQTAYFNQTAIIFTSNIGTSNIGKPEPDATGSVAGVHQIRELGIGAVPYEKVSEHFKGEVAAFFDEIGRAELRSRFGNNIVVFDFLRPQYVAEIGQKFTRQLHAAAMERFNLPLEFLPWVDEMLVREMSKMENLMLGGRQIGALLEDKVQKRVNAWIFEHFSSASTWAGRTLRIGADIELGGEACSN